MFDMYISVFRRAAISDPQPNPTHGQLWVNHNWKKKKNVLYIADDDSMTACNVVTIHKSPLVDLASRYRLCLLHVALVRSATKLFNTVTVKTTDCLHIDNYMIRTTWLCRPARVVAASVCPTRKLAKVFTIILSFPSQQARLRPSISTIVHCSHQFTSI